MHRALILVAAGLLGFVITAGAATYLVKPDGTGDFPTIQAAVDAAHAGDTVLLASGIFRGEDNNDIYYRGKAITIRSQSGLPDSCIIDCDGAFGGHEQRGFVFISGEGRSSVLEGVTIREGRAQFDGGAVWCMDAGPTIRNCKLYGNASTGHGGAINLTNAPALITGCWFEWNGTNGRGGAIGSWNSAAEVRGSTFIDNYTLGTGGALSISGTRDVIVEQCTFVGNLAPVGGGLFLQDSNQTRIRSCVVAFGLEGGGIRVEMPSNPEISCCDLYGNAGGDWVGGIANQEGLNGNFSADPCFCDLEAGDFHLWNYSPCNQAGLCGQIGAWPVGCTEPQEALEPRPPLAERFLLRAAPNPFTTTTTIDFTLPAGGDVRLHVLDSSGRLVRALVDGAFPAGPHRVPWDGLDDAARRPPSGAYYYRLEVDGSAVGTDAVVTLR